MTPPPTADAYLLALLGVASACVAFGFALGFRTARRDKAAPVQLTITQPPHLPGTLTLTATEQEPARPPKPPTRAQRAQQEQAERDAAAWQRESDEARTELPGRQLWQRGMDPLMEDVPVVMEAYE